MSDKDKAQETENPSMVDAIVSALQEMSDAEKGKVRELLEVTKPIPTLDERLTVLRREYRRRPYGDRYLIRPKAFEPEPPERVSAEGEDAVKAWLIAWYEGHSRPLDTSEFSDPETLAGISTTEEILRTGNPETLESHFVPTTAEVGFTPS